MAFLFMDSMFSASDFTWYIKGQGGKGKGESMTLLSINLVELMVVV